MTMPKTKAAVLEGEVITPDGVVVVAKNVTPATAGNAQEKRLRAIAVTIHKEFGKGIDSQFAIGHALLAAREEFGENDKAFGRWVAEQGFRFSQQTGHRLQQAALREPEIREFIATHSAQSGKELSVSGVVQALNAGPQPSAEEKAAAKRVQALVAEEPIIVDDAFDAFVKAAEALDMSVLELGDLIELAGIIQNLAAAYKAEKARR